MTKTENQQGEVSLPYKLKADPITTYSKPNENSFTGGS